MGNIKRWSRWCGGAALVLSACGPAGVPAVLTTESDTYPPGAEAVLVLRNTGDSSLDYNLCFSSLERLEGASWAHVPPDPQVFCRAIQLVLPPREVASERSTLPGSLPAGEYRFLTYVGWSAERWQVISTPFRVEPQAAP